MRQNLSQRDGRLQETILRKGTGPANEKRCSRAVGLTAAKQNIREQRNARFGKEIPIGELRSALKRFRFRQD